jgi:hypothetical protein
MSPRFVSVTAMRRLNIPRRSVVSMTGRRSVRPEVSRTITNPCTAARTRWGRRPRRRSHRDLQDGTAVHAAGRVDGPHARDVQRAGPRARVDLRLEAIDVEAGQRDVLDPADAHLAVAARAGAGRLPRVPPRPFRRARHGISTNSVDPARTGPGLAASTTSAFTRVDTIEGGPGSVGTTRPSCARPGTLSPGETSVSRNPSIAARTRSGRAATAGSSPFESAGASPARPSTPGGGDHRARRPREVVGRARIARRGELDPGNLRRAAAASSDDDLGGEGTSPPRRCRARAAARGDREVAVRHDRPAPPARERPARPARSRSRRRRKQGERVPLGRLPAPSPGKCQAGRAGPCADSVPRTQHGTITTLPISAAGSSSAARREGQRGRRLDATQRRDHADPRTRLQADDDPGGIERGGRGAAAFDRAGRGDSGMRRRGPRRARP